MNTDRIIEAMNTRPTPETNDLVKTQLARVGMTPSVLAAKITIKCESLERERDEWKAKYIQQNKDLGCEQMDPNGTIWDYAKTLQRERDEAREYADKLAEGLPDGMLPKDVEVLRESNLGLATELTAVTAQRDMLAEALRELWKNHTLHGAAYELIEQTLAAVKGGSE